MPPAGRLVEPNCARTQLMGLENRSICIGLEFKSGANSTHPEELSSAVALACAWTDRMVMNTRWNPPPCPFGPMQPGGWLMDTLTLAGWLLTIDELPQLAATQATATAVPNIKQA